MELFHRRYLCLFSSMFILASFVAARLISYVVVILISVFILLAAVAIIFLICNKKYRFAFSVILMTTIFALVGLLNSFFFVCLPQTNADKCIGEHTVIVRVIDVEYTNEHSSQYAVKLIQVDNQSVNIKARLHGTFNTEFNKNDHIVVKADIKQADNYGGSDRTLLLDIEVEDDSYLFYDRVDEKQGIFEIFSDIRQGFIDYIDSVFEESEAALVKGFLIGETSDISAKTISDFRRSGISHLLSVSGFHIALLLGSLELVFRKLYIPKKIRCIMIMLFGFFFLLLTDFAGSAVRSALMLFAVYAGFMFAEDNDAVTSLFASLALIIMFSPYAVYDLGLFMSFIATLGLVTIYPYFESKLPIVKTKKKAVKLLGKIYLWISRTILITVVANFFLLPIMWYFFGEISLTSIPANLLTSPISALYLPMCVVALVFGRIPLLGGAITSIVSVLGRAIEAVAEFFAKTKGGVVSLNYPFVAVLVLMFTLSMIVLLTVNLKHKMWICTPAAAFTVIFAIIVTVFSLTSEPKIGYVNKSNNDYLLLQKGAELTVCDISKGPSNVLWLLNGEIDPKVTEIENYIVTHTHKNHDYSIERLLDGWFIRNLYLPLGGSEEELRYTADVYNMAIQYNTNVIFYKSGDSIDIFSDLTIRPHFESSDNCSQVYIDIADIDTNEKMFTYSDGAEHSAALKSGSESRYFFLGAHKSQRVSVDEYIIPKPNTELILAHSEPGYVNAWNNKKYVLTPDKNKIISIIMPLT